MCGKNPRFRMDFIQEVIAFDREKGIIEARLIPDPRRYEWRILKGTEYLYDRLDNLLIAKDTLLSAIERSRNLPIYYQQQEVDDVVDYIKSRIPEIEARLRGYEESADFRDKSEEFLQSLERDELGFVILCVDIAGSTALSTSMDKRRFAKLIEVMTYEMSALVPKFHGHVLKYTGDGLIAYFAEPSFIGKNDLAIDCALTMRKLTYEGLNLILTKNGYPQIDIRIGIDSGEAIVTAMGSAATKRHKDIIGTVVSLASKIQAKGRHGDILLGEVALRNLHTMWREICEEVVLSEDWEYKGEGGNPYKIYRVKFVEPRTAGHDSI